MTTTPHTTVITAQPRAEFYPALGWTAVNAQGQMIGCGYVSAAQALAVASR